MNPADVLTTEAALLRVLELLGHGKDERRRMVEGTPPNERKQLLARLERRYSRKAAAMGRKYERDIQERMTADCEQNYALLRAISDRDRQKERDDMSLGQRLDVVLTALETASQIAAARVGHQSRSSESGDVRPLHGIPHDGVGRKAHLFVKWAEQELDKARLRYVPKPESSEEKNRRLIREWEGATPEEVAFFAPEFGRARSVERIRQRLGYRALDGRARLEQAA